MGIPVLAAIPQDDDLRKKSANYQIVGTSESKWGALFAAAWRESRRGPADEADRVDPGSAAGDSSTGPRTGAGITLEPASD